MVENLVNVKYFRLITAVGAVCFGCLFLINLYLSDETLLVFRVIYSIESTIAAYTGSHGETLEKLRVLVETDKSFYILFIFYCISSIMAIVFSLALVYDLIKLIFTRSKEGIRNFNSDSYVIFGFNDDVKTLIENSQNVNKRDIHIISSSPFKDYELREISKLGVSFDYMDLSGMSDVKSARVLKRKRFFKVKHVLLADECNYSLYRKLNGDLIKRNKELRISFVPMDSAQEQMIGNDNHILVNSISKKEIIAQSIGGVLSDILCADINLYRQKDIKCMVAGFDETELYLVRMLVNQLTVSCDTKIEIDIVDHNAKDNLGIALERVFTGYKSENGLFISNNVCDGELMVNSHNMSYKDDLCHEMLINDEYDFVILNLQEENDYTVFIEGNRSLFGYLPKTKFIVPVLLKTDISDNLFDGLDNIYRADVYAKYNLDLLKCDKTEENAIEFNYQYNSIYQQPEDDKYSLWINTDYYGKRSTLFQSFHQDINSSLINTDIMSSIDKLLIDIKENNSEDIIKTIKCDKYIEELAMIEHRRWTYFAILEGFRYSEIKNKGILRSDCILKWVDLCKKRPDNLIYDLSPFIILCEKSQCQNQN